MTGIIIKAVSGFYYVSFDGAVYECKARGNFRKSGVSPLVGDRVKFSRTESCRGIIDSVLERKNSLIRPPVANIDKLFVISSAVSPVPNAFVIDKMTAIARHNNIEPVIIFNKCDMADCSEWQEIYLKSGFKTFSVSARTGEGMADFELELKDGISAFTGNSGVGKSSILNYFFDDGIIATGEVSEKLGRGRHTTRHTQLYPLPFGGFVADTPGFSSLDVEYYDYSFKEHLTEYFTEFSDFKDNCKFTGCTHLKEKGCAVIEAVNKGIIPETRHNSYIQLMEEMQDLKPWMNKKK